MKQDTILEPGVEYRTHTRKVVTFLGEADGIVEYRDEAGNTVPMHSHLFRNWLLRRVAGVSKAGS